MSRLHGPLSLFELNEAALVCVKRAQTDSFMKDKADLTEMDYFQRKIYYYL
jgi:hypothetical protein